MLYPLLLIFSDFVALLAAFTVAYIFRVKFDDRPLVTEIEAVEFIKVFFLLIPIWLMIHAFLGLYNKEVYEKRLTELSRILLGSFIGTLLVIGYDFISADPIFPARLVVVYAFVGSFIFLALSRNVLWLFRRIMFRFGYGLRNVMIIGNTPATKELATLFSESKTSGYNIKVIAGGKSVVPNGFTGKQVASLDKALGLIRDFNIDSIIQTEFYEQERKNRRILMAARQHHLSYRFMPSQSEFYSAKNTVEIMNGYPIVAVHQTPLIGWGRVVKRVFDIIGSIIGLIISAPIMLVIGIIIKISDPSGPIFYKHERITRFGHSFYVYKIRSMYWRYSTGPHNPLKTEEEIFTAMGREDVLAEYKKYRKVVDDPRIMPIGKFIRATSLDELPQLWNVLKSELSLVGPRAMVASELVQYKKITGGGIVTSVKSGITGLWQVSGRSDISFEERVKLDKYYVQNWSFWLDIRILLKTVVVVFRRTGAR